MIYPEFPGKGDIIGICAPSAGIGDRTETFDLSIETLHKAGFKVWETDSVRSPESPSAPAEVRGAEFNALWEDDDIAAVISATGGDFNFEMVPFIDTGLVSAKPKWFAGYSDPTSIEMLLTTRLDIATIYGCNAGAWDWRPLHKFQENSLEIISGNLITQHSFEMYNGTRSFEDGYEMDTPVYWDLINAESLDVTGRLIGGCIEVIDSVIGTPYEDIAGFLERYKADGFIWFFDPFNSDPISLYIKILKMKYMGFFENAKAVVFGRVMFADSEDYEYVELLERALADVPFIWGADIGHTKPSMTIINGSIGHLQCADGKASLDMELK